MVSGFLLADAAEVARHRSLHDRIAGARPRIGLAWRSSNADFGSGKSLGLRDLAPVLQSGDVFWVDLQYGDTSAERAALETDWGIRVWRDETVDPLADMDAAGAQMAALDLVITTSNTAVHLAGSLGMPTWLMLPAVGYGLMWYWSADREDSPVYPSLRLFRPSSPAAGWPEVLESVGHALRGWLAGRAETQPGR